MWDADWRNGSQGLSAVLSSSPSVSPRLSARQLGISKAAVRGAASGTAPAKAVGSSMYSEHEFQMRCVLCMTWKRAGVLSRVFSTVLLLLCVFAPPSMHLNLWARSKLVSPERVI